MVGSPRPRRVTIPCPVCQGPFAPAGRRRYGSAACRAAAYRRRPLPRAAVAVPPPQPRRPLTVYACPRCEQRALGDQRCQDCGTFMVRVDHGGPWPHCDEPVALTDLLPSGGPRAPQGVNLPPSPGGQFSADVDNCRTQRCRHTAPAVALGSCRRAKWPRAGTGSDTTTAASGRRRDVKSLAAVGDSGNRAFEGGEPRYAAVGTGTLRDPPPWPHPRDPS